MKDKLKAIIFDLGGVILNIDYHKTIAAFHALGIENFEIHFSKMKQHIFFEKFEKGEVSEAEFHHYIRDQVKKKLSDDEINEAWNAMLLDFPIRRLQILQQLQLDYQLYLLSNTNQVHERAFHQILKDTCGYPYISLFFDKVYLSHQIGMRKPEVEIFKTILNNHDLRAEQTLFIDDSLQHIESAKTIGMQTIHLCDGKEMEDLFRTKQDP